MTEREGAIEAIARALLESESNGELQWDNLDLITRGAFKRDATAAFDAALGALEPAIIAVVDARQAIYEAKRDGRDPLADDDRNAFDAASDYVEVMQYVRSEVGAILQTLRADGR